MRKLYRMTNTSQMYNIIFESAKNFNFYFTGTYGRSPT